MVNLPGVEFWTTEAGMKGKIEGTGVQLPVAPHSDLLDGLE
jgi:hypothetical protein